MQISKQRSIDLISIYFGRNKYVKGLLLVDYFLGLRLVFSIALPLLLFIASLAFIYIVSPESGANEEKIIQQCQRIYCFFDGHQFLVSVLFLLSAFCISYCACTNQYLFPLGAPTRIIIWCSLLMLIYSTTRLAIIVLVLSLPAAFLKSAPSFLTKIFKLSTNYPRLRDDLCSDLRAILTDDNDIDSLKDWDRYTGKVMHMDRRAWDPLVSDYSKLVRQLKECEIGQIRNVIRKRQEKVIGSSEKSYECDRATNEIVELYLGVRRVFADVCN